MPDLLGKEENTDIFTTIKMAVTGKSEHDKGRSDHNNGTINAYESQDKMNDSFNDQFDF